VAASMRAQGAAQRRLQIRLRRCCRWRCGGAYRSQVLTAVATQALPSAQRSRTRQNVAATLLIPNPLIDLCTPEAPSVDSHGCGRPVFERNGVTNQAGADKPPSAKKYQAESAGCVYHARETCRRPWPSTHTPSRTELPPR
jgi:hypothetical protein